ncbi:hypothetical protein GCM10007160_42890 [Litchfieldella qijiaojingensis]|uniref:Uncharacterized protein n=1 Tax=Litchfieldella qijiaojingensis TaxID=980347 RepID=A0ABQ2ZBJ3_9GAMM|nr:hypothetical protein [Halomonas qijiaojingensis]GGY11292.1 hypothetical protein GCM10007160_42890 [Halomonas qijiaojingensis]
MTKQKNLPTSYTLEVYEPNDDSCVAAAYDSDTPFVAIAVGDYINPKSLNLANKVDMLKVTSVEHMLWQINGSHQVHKVCVRTQVVDTPLP